MSGVRVGWLSRLLVFGSTLVLALLLSLSPLPDWAESARPAWVLMVVVYWSLACPQWFGIGSAWLTGLTLDVLGGTLLGQHALGLVLVAALAGRYHLMLRNFSFLQQAILVVGLVLLDATVVTSINLAVGLHPDLARMLPTALTSGLLWPWVFLSLRATRRRFLRGLDA